MKKFLFLYFLSFLWTPYAFAFLLPATDKNLEPMATVESAPGQGFIDPDVFGARSYTMDCQCLYDIKNKQWDATSKTCLFVNECKACKSDDKTCEIRYPDYGTSNIYKKTYDADDPKKVKTEYCFVSNSTKPICSPMPGGGQSCGPDPNFKPNIVCEERTD